MNSVSGSDREERTMKAEQIKELVKSRYGQVALQNTGCCGPRKSCCGSHVSAEEIGRKVGYDEKDFEAVPVGANLGLGCGNPVALASLKAGDTVLDLGSGAGFDAFLAAARVGSSGRVIGVDMTPEMIEKARANASNGDFKNVEFRLGEIERLPVSNGEVDVIISNCVINLAPEKAKVFEEAFRVLRPGGRLMVSDLVLLRPLPEAIKKSVEAYVGCIAGASLKEDYLSAINAAGFIDVAVVGEDVYPVQLEPVAPCSLDDAAGAAGSVVSIKVSAVKPG